METIKLSDKLEKFLIEKGVKEQFIYNCEHCSIYVHTEVNADISRAFIFDKTSEGHKFWRILADEFEKMKDIPEQPEALHETQKKQILDYLKTGESITKLEALKMFGCWNSGDVIFNLRKEGYTIETTMITNGKKRFASYKLIENGKEN